MPRPHVDWPAHSAMSSHDALMVANGHRRRARWRRPVGEFAKNGRGGD
jgi:hypothetical protein